jgi:hypothetical protein
MNILLIEDELPFIEKLQGFAVLAGVSVLTPDSVGLTAPMSQAGTPIEDQIVDRLSAIARDHRVDMIMLDTDLSRSNGTLQTQSDYRQAAQALGIPVCRYRKGQTQTDLAKLALIQNLAIEGASAVLVPRDLLSGNEIDKLIPWLVAVYEGFVALANSLKTRPDLLSSRLGPSGILAQALGRPSLKADLLGYTAQNFFFFGAPRDDSNAEPVTTQWATRLGYWLYNYILFFPGPILHEVAAAAYLNLDLKSFQKSEVQKRISASRYLGPFNKLRDYYWRENLDEILGELDGNIANAPELMNTELVRIDSRNPANAAYYCLLTDGAILAEDAASNPDWIPAGAQSARISRARLEELGPMLDI